ncbi:DUF4214 domain-containing protein [Salinarimonas ramus]|uniref:Peptidase metallopeptidase domain-containing protein n=1 Tax=Salinarimonas ramus TaxID=690164 RepID=A0A917QFD0_9HYPH|nr:DUF4214 domain-containing protein [Salinarimonas ramus]GGK47241.1 hypothetical protein GCM10011322_37900 [Salinarimonas ramus]
MLGLSMQAGCPFCGGEHWESGRTSSDPAASSVLSSSSTVQDHTALLSGFALTSPVFGPTPVVVTYSFSSAEPTRNFEPGANPFVAPLDAQQRAMVRDALAQWEAAAGLTFIETSKHEGDILFGIYTLSSGAGGDASYPQHGSFVDPAGVLRVFSGLEAASGNVRFSSSVGAWSAETFLDIALHEIGHAIGLKHPFENTPRLDATFDNKSQTVMSYTGPKATALGPLDVAAARALYGAPLTPETTRPWSWDGHNEIFTRSGTAASEYLRGTNAADVVDTVGGRDAVVTFDGADRIVARGQSLEVNAGRGIDVVVNTVSRDLVSDIYIAPGGTFTRITIGSEQQNLVGVERVHFADVALALDLEGFAGQAYRLYEAALDRTPDHGGLGHWIAALDAGMPLLEAASGFIRSQEFRNLYGPDPDNASFVTAIYKNVLERDPEPQGFDYWLGKLTSGVTQAEVLLGFSESVENKNSVAQAIADGIVYDLSVA